MNVEIPTPHGFRLEAALHDGGSGGGAPASDLGAVVCHPHPAFGGRFDNPLVVALAGALAEKGVAALRFNFRGLGASGGTPSGGVAEHEDVAAASAWLRERGMKKVALVGYSFGSLMSLKALARGLAADAFVAVAVPTTIIGDSPPRTAEIERALDRSLPSLYLAGDRDQFCELDRLRAWLAPRAHARLEILAGRGHFFAGADEREVADRSAEFAAAALRK